jgi:hypothetical protein
VRELHELQWLHFLPGFRAARSRALLRALLDVHGLLALQNVARAHRVSSLHRMRSVFIEFVSRKMHGFDELFILLRLRGAERQRVLHFERAVCEERLLRSDAATHSGAQALTLPAASRPCPHAPIQPSKRSGNT